MHSSFSPVLLRRAIFCPIIVSALFISGCAGPAVSTDADPLGPGFVWTFDGFHVTHRGPTTILTPSGERQPVEAVIVRLPDAFDQVITWPEGSVHKERFFTVTFFVTPDLGTALAALFECQGIHIGDGEPRCNDDGQLRFKWLPEESPWLFGASREFPSVEEPPGGLNSSRQDKDMQWILPFLLDGTAPDDAHEVPPRRIRATVNGEEHTWHLESTAFAAVRPCENEPGLNAALPSPATSNLPMPQESSTAYIPFSLREAVEAVGDERPSDSFLSGAWYERKGGIGDDQYPFMMTYVWHLVFDTTDGPPKAMTVTRTLVNGSVPVDEVQRASTERVDVTKMWRPESGIFLDAGHHAAMQVLENPIWSIHIGLTPPVPDPERMSVLYTPRGDVAENITHGILWEFALDMERGELVSMNGPIKVISQVACLEAPVP